MIQPSDVHSLTDFLRNHKSALRRLRRRRRPELLTVNGRAAVIVQDADAFEDLMEAIERVEAVEGVRRGLASMKNRRGRPSAEVFAEIRKQSAKNAKA